MQSYAKVISGTEGSEDANAAVRLAGRLSAKMGVPLELVVAYDNDSGRDAEWAKATLEKAQEVATAGGATTIEPRIVSGKADDVLIDAGEATPDALIVVGAAGLHKSTSRLFGSTSNRLAHSSRADVLYVHDPLPHSWNFVAMATDGSDTSIEAARHGLILARALDARPRLITASKDLAAGEKLLASVASKIADEAGVDIEHEVLEDGAAGSALINKAWKFEVVVIGNRGMSGPSRLLGSVAGKVTHGIEQNLLLVNTTRD